MVHAQQTEVKIFALIVTEAHILQNGMHPTCNVIYSEKVGWDTYGSQRSTQSLVRIVVSRQYFVLTMLSVRLSIFQYTKSVQKLQFCAC